MLDFKRSSG